MDGPLTPPTPADTDTPARSTLSPAPERHLPPLLPALTPTRTSPASPSQGNGRAERGWHHDKAKFQLCRTDGFTCETESEHVADGTFVKFDGPATQNHMLVWKSRPRTVLVLKKRGRALLPHLAEVARHLRMELDLRVHTHTHTHTYT